MRFFRIIPLLLLPLMLAATAEGASVVELSLPAHIAQSTAVIEARVDSARAVVGKPNGATNTLTTLRIERVLQGEAPASITIRQIGGTLEGITTAVPGDAKFEVGAKVLVFVRKWDDGFWYLTALTQSVYLIKGEGSKATVERDFTGLSLFERGPDGRLVHKEGANPDFKTLGALRDAIGAAVRGPRK